jgi:hypothetical protein
MSETAEDPGVAAGGPAEPDLVGGPDLTPVRVEPNTPREAILARAADAPPAAVDFKPTDAHHKLAAALLDGDCNTWLELAEKSGVGRTTLWRVGKDPAACLWLSEQLAGVARASLGAIYSRLYRLAMTSRSPAAIELFLRRFDPEFKKDAGPVDNSINADFAVVTQMSASELEKFVALKARRAGLDSPKPAS